MLKNNNDKTPYELWKGSADKTLYIKVTQVYQRKAKEVQNGRLQTNYHSYANQLQVKQK
jgi:hypothetical protein